MDMFISLLVSGIVMGCIYGLVALGYSLIYKASGLMSFVQGDLMTVGAYLGITFYSTLKLPFYISFACIAVIMFALGMLLEKSVIRRLRGRGVPPIYVVLATIAVSYILQSACLRVWGTVTLPFPSIRSIHPIASLPILMPACHRPGCHPRNAVISETCYKGMTVSKSIIK